MRGRRCRRGLRSHLVSVAAAAVAAGAVGCAESPDRELRARFGAERPARVVIVRHAGSGPGMDHADVWELAPVDDAFVAALAREARLRRRSVGEPPVSGLVSATWPGWWDPGRIEALPEAYSRDGARAYWRVWVDRAADRIYVQWFDT